MKIHKGDKVQIMVGKDSGKQGVILKLDVKAGKVLIQGLNLFKKHRRPKTQNEKGEVVSVPRPLAIANVMLVCNLCGQLTRAGYKIESGNKLRYCKKCKGSF